MADRYCWLAALLLAGCVLDGAAPLPRDDRAHTVEDMPVVIAVLDNDYGDRDYVALSYAGIGYAGGAHGGVQLRDDGTVLYTPERDFLGEDFFFYVVGYRGATARARVTVEVGPDSEQFGEPIVLYASDYPMVALAAEFGSAGNADLIVEEGDRIVALALDEGLAPRVAQIIGEAGCCVIGGSEVGCCDRYNYTGVVVADIDGNGQSDVVRFGTRHSIELLLAQPAEGEAGVRYEAHPIDYFGPDAIEFDRAVTSAWPRYGAAGDFDGDGELDLAVGLGDATGLIVHFGVGSGTPRASHVFETSGVDAIASGDLDGDGITDVVAFTDDDEIVWIRGDRAAPLRLASGPLRVAPISSIPAVLLVGDVDGRPGDEVVLPQSGQVLRVAAGPLGPRLELLSSTADVPRAPALADLDGDGRADLLGLGYSEHGLELWRATERDGVPAFAFAVDFALPHAGPSPLVLDFDGDGALDVIVSRVVPLEKRAELVLLPGRQLR